MQRGALNFIPVAEDWYLLPSVVNKKLPECSSRMVVRKGFAISNISAQIVRKKKLWICPENRFLWVILEYPFPERLAVLHGSMGRNSLWSYCSVVTQHSVMKEHCWHSSHFNASPLQQKLLCIRVVWRQKFIYYISETKTPDGLITSNQYKTNRNILHY